MNIQQIETFGMLNCGVEVAKIIVVLQDDSRKILLCPKPVIRQIIEQSVEKDGKGKLYIFDNFASEWLKDDLPNLPYKLSQRCE